MFKVLMGVKGASRVIERAFDDRTTAELTALRWSLSNSIGSYWARVKDPEGATVKKFN